MKKSTKIILGVVIAIIFICVLLLIVFNGKFSSNSQEASKVEGIDKDILLFLKKSNVISKEDKYQDYDQDIGINGAEGSKRYIYERNDKTYYYVAITKLSYSGNGNYGEYSYKSGEIFYKIEIQDCKYNPNAESIDKRILNERGEFSFYVVSGEKKDFKLTKTSI